MRLQNGFNGGRRDIAAAADDDVFLATDHPQIAVVVDLADITRANPAVAHDFAGFRRVIPIAVHRE